MLFIIFVSMFLVTLIAFLIHQHLGDEKSLEEPLDEKEKQMRKN